MKTQIFKDYAEFMERLDKKINGVSPAFAANNAEFLSDNETNSGCWNCSDCSYCSSCSDCSDCRSCSDCSSCSSAENTIGNLLVPIIESIHSKIADAIGDGACNFDMGSWHCGTTHCRAGWVVTLAGEEGKRLESETDTCFAAMMIYKKSSPEIHVPPTRFFESNEAALADIARCAELETAK